MIWHIMACAFLSSTAGTCQNCFSCLCVVCGSLVLSDVLKGTGHMQQMSDSLCCQKNWKCGEKKKSLCWCWFCVYERKRCAHLLTWEYLRERKGGREGVCSTVHVCVCVCVCVYFEEWSTEQFSESTLSSHSTVKTNSRCYIGSCIFHGCKNSHYENNIEIQCVHPHGLAFTRQGRFLTKLAHSFLSHLCLSFCLPESLTCTSFHPSTSPDISAVF